MLPMMPNPPMTGRPTPSRKKDDKETTCKDPLETEQLSDMVEETYLPNRFGLDI